MSNMDTQDYLREIERDAKRKADIAQREREIERAANVCMAQGATYIFDAYDRERIYGKFVLDGRTGKTFGVRIGSPIYNKLGAYYSAQLGYTQAVQS